MGTIRYRTRSGQPSAAARRKTGTVGTKLPIFDRESAENAIRLRGKTKPPLSNAERMKVISRARKLVPGLAARATQVERLRRRGAKKMRGQ